MRPTWAEVSLSTLRRNFRITQDFVGPNVTVCAVVKADAYGHGAVECARALEREGAAWFGVTSTEEGVRLREAGIGGRVLLMTGFWRGEEEEVVRHKLTPAVWQPADLELLGRAARKLGIGRVPVHLKLDTGMARLGVARAALPAMFKLLRAQRNVAVEGIFSHLASAEVIGALDTVQQLAAFRRAAAQAKRAGLQPRFLHLANSAAIAAGRDFHYNFVRPGLSLYGYNLPFTSPSGRPSGVARPLEVRPVLAWKTRIVGLRNVAKRQRVGYGGTFVARRASRLAVLPVGYADGLSRHLSSVGRVMIRGQYCPIVGRVSMDLTLVDVTAVRQAAVGDEATILGEQIAARPIAGKPARLRIDAWEHATHADTVPYEILCGISKRVPRQYIE
jgi:alanine racemase